MGTSLSKVARKCRQKTNENQDQDSNQVEKMNTIKKLKNGSLTLLFNVEGVDYSIILSKEDDGINNDTGDDSGNKKALIYKVKLSAGHRNVLLEKVYDGENPPEFKIEGEGMDKKEMVEFGHNWMTMVCGSFDSLGLLQTVDMNTMGFESFINMFNFFFGERLQQLMEEEEEMEVGEEDQEQFEDYC